jgi:hypothetical protein
MIAVRVKFADHPEQLAGPFGHVQEAINWITSFKEVLYLNRPDATAELSTLVIHDPVQAMSWAASTTHPESVHKNKHSKVNPQLDKL